ncbi:hypothetical protein OG365_01115 [Streptomyces sp. NBC_00853]|uniref:hypothetical protein n=1 Tax=Streptomyces sp. NBC_00853 TaxID=2903681 RepID=UPI0038732777|nr:hypothetical protein OG365_01115 [Streptomyces sp. NBC_00853]
MNSLVAWTFVLVSFVAVLVVREAYREERLGVALLVGVSVATLLLLLVSIDGGANIPGPTAPVPSSTVSTAPGRLHQDVGLHERRRTLSPPRPPYLHGLRHQAPRHVRRPAV